MKKIIICGILCVGCLICIAVFKQRRNEPNKYNSTENSYNNEHCGHSPTSNYLPTESIKIELDLYRLDKKNVWTKKQPGLFELYNSIVNDSTYNFVPYDYEAPPARPNELVEPDRVGTNCYPLIFYLNLQPDSIAAIDTLKYNWRHDEIYSICHDDRDYIGQSMMWSSRDTIYTYGTRISRSNQGVAIGNMLYDRAIINELRYRNNDTILFKSELDGYRYNHYSTGRYYPTNNFYCKIVIRNGKVVSYFTHVGQMTKQQYRDLYFEEKERVKIRDSEHNSDL